MSIQPGTVIRVTPYKDTQRPYPTETVTFLHTYAHSDIPGEEFVAIDPNGNRVAYRYNDID